MTAAAHITAAASLIALALVAPLTAGAGAFAGLAIAGGLLCFAGGLAVTAPGAAAVSPDKLSVLPTGGAAAVAKGRDGPTGAVGPSATPSGPSLPLLTPALAARPHHTRLGYKMSERSASANLQQRCDHDGDVPHQPHLLLSRPSSDQGCQSVSDYVHLVQHPQRRTPPSAAMQPRLV